MADMFGGKPLLSCSSGRALLSLTIGGLRETSNLAPHAMVADVHRVDDVWEPIYFSPTGQSWEKGEIFAMRSAFYYCLDCLNAYPSIAPEC